MDQDSRPGTVFIVHAETIGRGDDVLGAKLMKSFFRTLIGIEKPDAIVFYNAAVRLLANDSAYLDELKALEEAGVDLLACITCLDFYALEGKIQVGTVSNMREICQRLSSAARVVTL